MSDITRDYSFGGWLRHFRLEKRLTLREAARQMGIDAGNYCKLERSEHKPPKSRGEILQLLQFFDAEKNLNFMCNLAFQDHIATLRARFIDHSKTTPPKEKESAE